MPRINFDPAKGFNSIANRMNDLVNDFEKGVSVEYGGYAPRVDISEDDKKIYIQAELAGVKKEDVSVSINEENILFIKGDKKKVNDEKDFCCIRSERNFGSFSRSFMLQENLLTDSIEAKYDNGVLNIAISKIEPEKPKEVKVEIK
jgi:HSP20 family protein